MSEHHEVRAGELFKFEAWSELQRVALPIVQLIDGRIAVWALVFASRMWAGF